MCSYNEISVFTIKCCLLTHTTMFSFVYAFSDIRGLGMPYLLLSIICRPYCVLMSLFFQSFKNIVHFIHMILVVSTCFWLHTWSHILRLQLICPNPRGGIKHCSPSERVSYDCSKLRSKRSRTSDLVHRFPVTSSTSHAILCKEVIRHHTSWP